MARLVLRKLSKVFPGPAGGQITALADVDLVVADGQLLVLLGPSGSGKTVLLRLIAGLERPSAGSILLGDSELQNTPARERDIGMVFQNNALYPHLNAGDNMGFGLRLRRVPRAEARARVRETAALLGISDCLERRPAELSGGQRQRVALGRVLVRRPPVVLLDEPFSSLDAQLRFELRDELLRLQALQGWTGIYVTHDQAEAMAMGRQMSVLRLGRIQQTGTPDELYLQPANRFVAGFLGSPPMNFVRGRLLLWKDNLCFQETGADQRAPLALPGEAASRLSAHAGKEVLLGLRPHHIALRRASPTAQGEEPATVERGQWLGADAYVEVKARGQPFWGRAEPGARFRAGDSVALLLRLEAAYFFDPATERVL